MGLKKKMKAFFTLKRRANDGFTLVELIVVIAILAILAGVGSVGYAGYIKAANKGNDKVLVGNIMRAIETGTNSYAFVGEDSFKMGKLSYPVGFVALSTTSGAQVITSTTEVYPATEGKCEWETISGIVKIENKTKSYLCEQQRNIQYVVVTELEPITYCKTHSAAPAEQSLTGTYVSGWNHEQGTKNDSCLGEIPSCENGCKKFELVYTAYPENAKTVTNLDSLYVPSTNDALMCEAAYANQYDTFGDPEVGAAQAGDPLLDSITAAFGSDLSALKLSYEGWTSEEGAGYASLYTSAPELMGNIQTMANTLAPWAKYSSTANKLGLSQTYGSSDEILTGVSDNIITGYNGSPENMLAAWNNDSAMTWDSYGFNLGAEQYRENYAAMRAAYNSSFASYMDANGASQYSNGVRNYGKPLIGDYDGLTLPALVCTDAFTDPESGLQDQLGCTDEEFEEIAALYKEYIESGACNENGSVLYDVFDTVNSTADVASAYKNMNGGSVYDYYNRYVGEMSALYEAANAAAGDGIIIIVTVEEGKLNFQVSPAAANPRND